MLIVTAGLQSNRQANCTDSYRQLKRQPNMIRELYRNLFSTARSSSNSNRQVNARDGKTEPAQKMIIKESYGGSHDATVQAEHAQGLFPDSFARLLMYLLSFAVNLGVLFSEQPQSFKFLGVEILTRQRMDLEL